MILKIHAKAIEAFNAKASSLLLRLVKMPPQENKEVSPTTSAANLFSYNVDITMTENMVMASVDGFGITQSKFFQTKDGMIGYDEKSLPDVLRYIDEILKQPEIMNIATNDYILEIFSEWVKDKYNGDLDHENSFFNSLQFALDRDVKKRTLAFPP